MKIFNARTGVTHFLDESVELDWFAQNVLCGAKNLRGFVSKKSSDGVGVRCMKCMTKSGYVKKETTKGIESSPGLIGFRTTIYKVLVSFDRLEQGRKLTSYLPGDTITGNTYDRARAKGGN